jgi:hypothetical protein
MKTHSISRSWNSAVSRVTRSHNTLDNPGFDPQQWQEIYVFSKTSTQTLRPTHSPIQLIPGAVLPGKMWLKHEADHSRPSSAEVKNKQSCNSVMCGETTSHFTHQPNGSYYRKWQYNCNIITDYHLKMFYQTHQ